jgi:alanine dehydrogenase
VLLSGASGAEPARILVLGAGVVGSNAAQLAMSMGAAVTVLSRPGGQLQRLSREYGGRVTTGISTPAAIEEHLCRVDAVVGAALVPGALAPRLVTRAMLAVMRRSAVIVDVSIDQGGCFETSRPTTHADPVYTVDGILHYCVANMPGAVPRTSTYALNHATLPFVTELADRGVAEALKLNAHLRSGLNVCRGAITCREVAAARGSPYTEPLQALGNPG